jgi:hypothetical protein
MPARLKVRSLRDADYLQRFSGGSSTGLGGGVVWLLNATLGACLLAGFVCATQVEPTSWLFRSRGLGRTPLGVCAQWASLVDGWMDGWMDGWENEVHEV